MLRAEEFVPCVVAPRRRRCGGGGAQVKLLTMDQARAIRELVNGGATTRSVAAQFGVNPGTISCVVNNKTYRERE